MHSRKESKPPFQALRHLGTLALKEIYLKDNGKENPRSFSASNAGSFPSKDLEEAKSQLGPLLLQSRGPTTLVSPPVLATPEITTGPVRSRRPSFSTSELNALGRPYRFQDEDKRNYTSRQTCMLAIHDGNSLCAGLAIDMELSLTMQACLIGRRRLAAFERHFERQKQNLLVKEEDIKKSMRLMSQSLANIHTIGNPEDEEEEKRLKKAFRHLERRHALFLKRAEELHDELMWRTREQDARQKEVDQVLDGVFVECGLLDPPVKSIEIPRTPDRIEASVDRGDVDGTDDEDEEEEYHDAAERIREWLSETVDSGAEKRDQSSSSEKTLCSNHEERDALMRAPPKDGEDRAVE